MMMMENAYEGGYECDVTQSKGHLQKSCQVLPSRALFLACLKSRLKLVK